MEAKQIPNRWCAALGIEDPKLEAVAGHREANTYSLLIVALLERGEPMTLDEVAVRFEEAGIADRAGALLSLQRCKPGRAPVYRDGDRYHLDPHDDELDLWAFRLGLRPPRVQVDALPRPHPAGALPGPEVPLTAAELDEAWRDAGLNGWSAQRIALAVLDANGEPLEPERVVVAVSLRSRFHSLRVERAPFDRKGSAVSVLPDGRWAIAEGADTAVQQTRVAVRALVERARKYASTRPDPAALAAAQAAYARERAEHGAALARMSRALLVAFPADRPRAAALLDVQAHEIVTYVDDELGALRARLGGYEIIGAEDVRALLRALDFDPGERRLAELGPPQKTMKIDQRGRTLRIATALLVQGSCGISQPFGDEARLAAYLAEEQHGKLRRRLEADVKSLHALYEYGRLHGAVRLRWGFLDERIPAPWVHRDEPKLYHLKEAALAEGRPLEVVVGTAPGGADRWARAQRVWVEQEPGGWRSWLVDEEGYVIPDEEVQRARRAAAPH